MNSYRILKIISIYSIRVHPNTVKNNKLDKKGRDGRTWMLDPEGFHIVYCCTNAHDGDYGIGVHWANEIELSLPVSRVNTAESEMTRDIGTIWVLLLLLKYQLHDHL